MGKNQMLERFERLAATDPAKAAASSGDPIASLDALIVQLRQAAEQARAAREQHLREQGAEQLRMDDLRRERDSWYARAETAARARDDDAARKALERRLQATNELKALEQRHAHLRDYADELDEVAGALDARVLEAELRREIARLERQRKAAATAAGNRRTPPTRTQPTGQRSITDEIDRMKNDAVDIDLAELKRRIESDKKR